MSFLRRVLVCHFSVCPFCLSRKERIAEFRFTAEKTSAFCCELPPGGGWRKIQRLRLACTSLAPDRGLPIHEVTKPCLDDRHPGSAQGTTPTVSRPPFVLTHFRTFALMGPALSLRVKFQMKFG